MSEALVFRSILGKDQQSFAVGMILYWGLHLIVIGTAQYDTESSLRDMEAIRGRRNCCEVSRGVNGRTRKLSL